MKRTIYIFCLWWATLAVLSVSIMLHHHHVDEVCFALEECASDGNINDIHTQHAPTEGEGTPSDYCAVETAKQFIPARGTASMSAKWGGAQTSHPLVALYGACVPLKAQRRQERPHGRGHAPCCPRNIVLRADCGHHRRCNDFPPFIFYDMSPGRTVGVSWIWYIVTL